MRYLRGTQGVSDEAPVGALGWYLGAPTVVGAARYLHPEIKHKKPHSGTNCTDIAVKAEAGGTSTGGSREPRTKRADKEGFISFDIAAKSNAIIFRVKTQRSAPYAMPVPRAILAMRYASTGHRVY
eukprot:1899328-Rhodomonas_salina.1